MGETVPIRPGRLLVRSLRVEVVRGADAGRSQSSDRESLHIGSAPDNDLALADRTVSRYHVELRPAGDRIRVTDLGSTNGTEIGTTLVQNASVAVAPGTVLRIGHTDLRVDDAGVLSLEVHAGEPLGGLQGRTPVMLRLMAIVRNVAQAEVPVLVVGEYGSGKERVARALHDASPRVDRPFVVVECGGTPGPLLQDELFDAFDRARDGTVLLDDVGVLSAELQTMLAAALERGSLRRERDGREVATAARLIAATPRDLRADVNAGSFRLDLYHRLAVVMIRVPALRDRADDIPLLVENFLREADSQHTLATVFTPDALEAMRTYAWPGNVRELRNVVLATLALGEAPSLDAPEAEPRPLHDAIGEVLDLQYREARAKLLSEFESRYLGRLLERTRGNVRQAAREARMDRSYLIELLRRHRP